MAASLVFDFFADAGARLLGSQARDLLQSRFGLLGGILGAIGCGFGDLLAALQRLLAPVMFLFA